MYIAPACGGNALVDVTIESCELTGDDVNACEEDGGLERSEFRDTYARVGTATAEYIK